MRDRKYEVQKKKKRKNGHFTLHPFSQLVYAQATQTLWEFVGQQLRQCIKINKT